MSVSTDPADAAAAWPAAWTAALSDGALVAASSAAIVARGVAYARSGAVRVDDEDPMPEPALRARVTGTSTYHVEVWIEADAVAGDCDCPHAEDGWFCKHQVAVSMVWRQRLSGREPSTRPSASEGRAPCTALERRQALHDFLQGQDAATLADKLLDLAARHRDVDRELQQWRKLDTLGGDWAGIRRVVSGMLSPARDFIAWDEATAYVARAAAVLPVLRKTTARDATASVSLALHALREVWAVVEQADDSDGAISGFCEAIGAEFVAALHAAPDPPSDFGDVYLALRLDEPFRAFDAQSAEAAMGAAALGHYRQTLRSRWHATRGVRSRGSDTVEQLHLEQLVQAGEIDDALAVLRSDLTTPTAHRRVVRFLEEHGRFREAFRAAEAALRQHPGDQYLEGDLLRCYERDGWTEEAFALRHRQFERQPTVERYQAVVAAAAAAGRPAEAVRATLFEVLRAAELQAMAADRSSRSHARRLLLPVATGSSHPPPIGPNVSLRASILGAESRWLDAWASVQPPNVCSDAVLQRIARHLPPTHDQEAVRVLAQVFERVMLGSSSPHAEALALVGDIASRMEAKERSAWLQGLRARFRAKRNFIRDLPAA